MSLALLETSQDYSQNSVATFPLQCYGAVIYVLAAEATVPLGRYRSISQTVMSGIRGFVSDGWHPKGKDGGKESWRGDFKGVNQVVSCFCLTVFMDDRIR